MYVSEIDLKVSENEVREYFGQFGNCSVAFLKDSFANTFKGSALVIYQSDSYAEKAQ